MRKFNIKVVNSIPNKLNVLIKNGKDKLEKQQRTGVYQIKCSCKKSYIGESKRNVRTRIQEHLG